MLIKLSRSIELLVIFMSLVPLRSVKAFHSSSFPRFPNMTYRDILLVNKGFSSWLLPWVSSAVFTSLQELSLAEG